MKPTIRKTNKPTIRKFGKTKVSMTWDGKVYHAVVTPPRGRAEKFLFSKLPDHFKLAPESKTAFDITAQSAYGALGDR